MHHHVITTMGLCPCQHASTLLNLLEEMDNADESSDSSSSSLSFESDSSSSSFDDDNNMLVVNIMEALQMSASILDDLEMRIEDQTIIWQGKGDKLMIKDLTEDFAISHFCFRTAHLQEVADTIWSGPVCVDGSRDSRHQLSTTMETIQLPTRTFT